MPVVVVSSAIVRTMTVPYYLLVCCSLCAASVVQSATPTLENMNVTTVEDDYEERKHQSDPRSRYLTSDIPMVIEEPLCDSCSSQNSTQCLAEDYPGCKCDAMCQVYDDCCIDPPNCEPPLSYSKVGPSLSFTAMECNSLYHEIFASDSQETYWMIAYCPDRVDDTAIDINVFNHQCITGSTAPVSDERTGIIYKNEFCAVCHSVISITRWPFTYTCKEYFKELLSTQSVDLDTFFENCSPCRYVIPTSLYNSSASELVPPRSCLIHTSICPTYQDYLLNGDETILLLSEDFQNAEYHCIYGPYSPILGTTIRAGNYLVSLYKNVHCALCNGAIAQEYSQCPVFSDSDLCSLSTSQLSNKFERPGPTFNLLLDINRDGGATIVSTETVTGITELQTSCDKNSVFDPSTGLCREIVCPPKYIAREGQCVKPLPSEGNQFGIGDDIPQPNYTRDFGNSDTEKVSPNSLGVPDSTIHVTTPFSDDTAPTDSTCSLVSLVKGEDSFTSVGNGSVSFEGILFTIVAFDDSQNPVICTTIYSFSNASRTSHYRRIRQIAPALFIAPSLITVLISVVLQLVLRKLYSVYTTVIINLALALFLNDTFLLSTYSSVTSLSVIHFLWHSCSLAVATWLCVLVVHISLSFRKWCKHPTASLNFSQKATLVCLYITFGWGLPLLVALVKNELYGPWIPCLNTSFGLCGPLISSIAFFIVPILIAVAFCILISMAIFKTVVMPSPPLNKQTLRRFYVFLVLVFTFTVSWIFGFIYLLSPSLLIATVGFFTFLLLKLVNVLIFFFGLVLTKRLRQTVHDLVFNSNQKNRVHPLPLPKKELRSPDVTVTEVPTSSMILSDKTHYSV